MNDTEALSPREVAIYHPIERRMEEGHQLVGTFVLDPATGSVSLTVLREEARVKLQEFFGGIASIPLRRTVTPQEGDMFLDALLATLQSSTYWRPLERQR